MNSGDLNTFVDDEASADQRKSAFLIAGLTGLGRLDEGTAASFANRLGFSLERQSRWTRAINAAAANGNAAMVAMFAALGMQGESWAAMTPRQLYIIISALRRVGLEAEARMIAAEAVARA